MIGQGLAEVVPEVPTQQEAVSHDAHELALGAQVLEEHHKLEQNPLNTMPPLR
jgi:hypothetical protein